LLLLPHRGFADLLIRPPFQPDPSQTINLKRTLTLLTSSGPDHRTPVRILFYGQSITLQEWWLHVAEYLRKTYPYADFTIENRAVSNMLANSLARLAYADVIPFQPDLIILHTYGEESAMEILLQTLRTITTTDILLMGDHICCDGSWLTDESDPAKIAPTDNWPYRNYVTMPRQAAQYEACFAAIRTEWRRYLLTNSLPASSLLLPGDIHLNTDGNQLMGDLVSAFLAPRSFEPPFDPDNGPRIRALSVGPEFAWHAGELDASFTGSQLNVVYNHNAAGRIRVEIDGKPPAQIQELYDFTRTSKGHALHWPAILRVQKQALLLEETWTATPLDVSPQLDSFTFSVSGSLTGPDGEGSSRTRFVSNSGRVVIDPGDWGLILTMIYSRTAPPPGYQVTWQAVRHFLPEFEPQAFPNPAFEISEPIAIGLSDGPHIVRFIAEDGYGGGVRALRTFSPSGAAAIRAMPNSRGTLEDGLLLRRVGDTNQLYLPTAWTGFQLEYSPTFDAKPAWKAVTNTPKSGIGVIEIDHKTVSNMGFYRLRMTNTASASLRTPAAHFDSLPSRKAGMK
jgi:hypothetical protein